MGLVLCSSEPRRYGTRVTWIKSTFSLPTSKLTCLIASKTGTLLGSLITKTVKGCAADGTYTINLSGSAGQSFGAFIPKGLTLNLFGDANDYFGKGLSGGILVARPPKNANYRANANVIIGNVALYGATGGEAYVSGIGGERFCVRNSGAVAVIEGCGDHCCEYMTGGKVAVLGAVGKNFGAGMSGGVAYVLDEKHDLYLKINRQMVNVNTVEDEESAAELKQLVETHVKLTDSAVGKAILADFSAYLPRFKKVVPCEYQRITDKIAKFRKKGDSAESAELKAFYEMKAEKEA